MASEGDGGHDDGQQQEAGPSTEAAARMLQQLAVREGKALKDKYAFWETQPVAQFSEDSAADSSSGKEGPIEVGKRVEDVKQEPYSLPDSYEWSTCDFTDAAVVKEVYELLSNNYVEDDDCMFRFNYSPAFLQWCCKPPGQHPEWLVGVRARTATRRLVAFIAAVPAVVSVDGAGVEMVEINFLCVHKKLRSKRLAPVLIKEITRRVNLHNIWQAAYTAGVLIPKPIGTCRYWHRSLNAKKLVEIGFSRLQPRMTMARTIKLYALNAEPATPGLRAMRPSDVPAVTRLINSYYSKFRITQVFDEKETAHWFSPQADVIDAYVVEEAATGTITDLVSFYTLPSSVLGHPQHTELKAAYMFYTVPATVSLKQLLNDALIFARNKGYDVFNALDLGQNAEVLKDLKFGIGDGQLHYYLYNWRVAKELTPQEVGLILM